MAEPFDLTETAPTGVTGFDAAALDRLGDHFRGYVDEGRLPFVQLAVTRRGRLAFAASHGLRDVEAGLPIANDTIVRIYSMTKPVTAVAVMMLVEAGLIELNDPISRYIPAFAQSRVFTGGTAEKPVTAPARQQIQIRHLLTHTSGMVYAHGAHPVDDIYKARGYVYGGPVGATLENVVNDMASIPLLFEPGTAWAYSHATDVLGRLVEVVSGVMLDEFFRSRILGPLEMEDTAFVVPPAKLSRLAALYRPAGDGIERFDELGREVIEGNRFLSGGGGLASTTRDYLRFAAMLLNGGSLDGVRLLGPRTVALMARNHLPGGRDLEGFGRPIFAEMPMAGIGHGLGVSVVVDPARYGVTSSAGEFGWNGAASTTFLVDPREAMTAVFMTQLIPSSTYPLRTRLRALLYGALAD